MYVTSYALDLRLVRGQTCIIEHYLDVYTNHPSTQQCLHSAYT